MSNAIVRQLSSGSNKRAKLLFPGGWNADVPECSKMFHFLRGRGIRMFQSGAFDGAEPSGDNIESLFIVAADESPRIFTHGLASGATI